MFISSKVNVISASLSLAGFADDVEVFALRLDSRKQKQAKTEGPVIDSADKLFETRISSKIVTIKQYTKFSKATSCPDRCQEGDVAGNSFAERPFFMTTEPNAQVYTRTQYLKQWGCTQLLHVLTGTEFRLVNLRNIEFLKDFVAHYESQRDVQAVDSIKLMTGYDVTDRDQYFLAKKCMIQLRNEYLAECNSIDNGKIIHDYIEKRAGRVGYAKLHDDDEARKAFSTLQDRHANAFRGCTEKGFIEAYKRIAYKSFDLRKLEQKIDGKFLKYDKDEFTWVAEPLAMPSKDSKSKGTLNRICISANDNEVLKLLKEFVEDEKNKENYAKVMGYFWVGDKAGNNWWHSKGGIIDEVALFQQYMQEGEYRKALWITNADEYPTWDFSKKESAAFQERFSERVGV